MFFFPKPILRKARVKKINQRFRIRGEAEKLTSNI